uniref:Cytochrome b561 domain-containing protein n=1 Tax=Guillardia theta TaxID=55529 RepID=A0A7S4K7M4_GUITH|mmetsp:Transcript_21743/g.71921  ORF Transcript_21743/g.71921 Transcript_21743/m.71921 type:complete len:263 (+) Transcript_21743:203-991(+)
MLLVWLLPRVCALALLGIVIAWVILAEGGFGTSSAALFGWHALGMTLFLIATSEGILIKSFPLWSRMDLWMGHVAFHLLGIICALLGLVAIIQYKSLSGQGNGTPTCPMTGCLESTGQAGLDGTFPFSTMYSAHSWMGVLCLLLWGGQLAGGVASSLYPWRGPEQREAAKKHHRFFGQALYVLLIATCCMGLQDMQSSDLAGFGYGIYSSPSLLACGASLVISIYGLTTLYALFFSKTQPAKGKQDSSETWSTGSCSTWPTL